MLGKALLGETCRIPFMDRLVDEIIRNYLPSQAVSNKTSPEPIKISPFPKAVWSEISLDFCGPFLSGNYYFMVVIDDYSRYPIVERITSLKGEIVIPRLQSVFSLFAYVSYV